MRRRMRRLPGRSGLAQFLAGTWTREEAAEFDAIIEEMFETIDEHMWQ